MPSVIKMVGVGVGYALLTVTGVLSTLLEATLVESTAAAMASAAIEWFLLWTAIHVLAYLLIPWQFSEPLFSLFHTGHAMNIWFLFQALVSIGDPVWILPHLYVHVPSLFLMAMVVTLLTMDMFAPHVVGLAYLVTLAFSFPEGWLRQPFYWNLIRILLFLSLVILYNMQFPKDMCHRTLHLWIRTAWVLIVTAPVLVVSLFLLLVVYIRSLSSGSVHRKDDDDTLLTPLIPGMPTIGGVVKVVPILDPRAPSPIRRNAEHV